MSYVVSASASAPVKFFAIAALAVELLVSALWPTWFMGLLVGIQVVAVWEAFRVFSVDMRKFRSQED